MREFIKIVIPYIKPYKLEAFLNIFFNFLGSVFSLFSLASLIPFLRILFNPDQLVLQKPEFAFNSDSMMGLINYYLSSIIVEQGKLQALFFVSLFILITVLLKNLFTYLANFFIAPLRNGILKDIRNQIYKKVLNLHLGFFSEERKGDIISRMTTDAQEFEWSALATIEMLFRDPVLILIFFGSLVFFSPQLTFFVLILLPISGYIVGKIGKTLKRASAEARRRMGNLLSYMEETIGGLRIIKAFNAEKKIEQRFVEENKTFTRVMNNVARRDYLASPMSEFLGVFTLLIVLYYGGRMVLSNHSNMAPEVFIGYIGIFSQIIKPAKNITTGYYKIQKGLAAMNRITEVLNTEIAITEKADAVVIKEFKDKIVYDNVHFKYDEIEVLKDIHLSVAKGKTLALVGQSGSGKSTLVDLLPRFYDIQEGDITIDGISIKDLKIKDLRALIGYVNQEPILFNDSIFNNIAFGMDHVDPEEVIAAAKVANAHDFIMETPNGYQTNIGDRGSKLSGGQRQRLSIARAVLKNPPILILDEATSALDTESERLVQDALTKLMKNRTSIVIAHRLSTIKYADEICVMQEGKIIERGTHNELIKKEGAYKKLHDLQAF